MLLDLLSDAFRPATDDHASFQSMLGGNFAEVALLGGGDAHHRRDGRIPGRQKHRHGHAQKLVAEVLEVGFGLPERRLVRFPDIDGDGPSQLVIGGGIAVLGRRLAVHFQILLDRLDGAEGLQICVLAVRIGGPVDGFLAALGRNPDGRMGVLIGAWPDVHVAHVEILALKFEGSGFRPGADDEVVGLVETAVGLGGRIQKPKAMFHVWFK